MFTISLVFSIILSKFGKRCFQLEEMDQNLKKYWKRLKMISWNFWDFKIVIQRTDKDVVLDFGSPPRCFKKTSYCCFCLFFYCCFSFFYAFVIFCITCRNCFTMEMIVKALFFFALWSSLCSADKGKKRRHSDTVRCRWFNLSQII